MSQSTTAAGLPSTLTTATFALTVTGGPSVIGAVGYVGAGSIATFTPAASLLPSTRQAMISDVTDSVVPPAINEITTMSQSGRWLYSQGKSSECSP